MKNMEKITECDGCCYRKTCSHELEKCQYLVKGNCLIKENNNGDLIL